MDVVAAPKQGQPTSFDQAHRPNQVSCAACAFDVVNQQLVMHMLAMVPCLPLHVSVKLDLSLSHSGSGM